jgi:hypothetical protein
MQFVQGSINSVPDIYLHLIIMRGILLFFLHQMNVEAGILILYHQYSYIMAAISL